MKKLLIICMGITIFVYSMDESYGGKKTRRFSTTDNTHKSLNKNDPQIPLLATLYYFYKVDPVTRIKDLRMLIASRLWKHGSLSTELISILTHFLQSIGNPRTIIEHDSYITSLTLNKSGDTLFIGGLNAVTGWNIKNINIPVKQVTFSLDKDEIIYIHACAIRPDDQYCVLAGTAYDSPYPNGIIQIWDIRNTHKAVAQKTLEPAHGHQTTVVAFNKDGTLLLSGSMDSKIKLWNTTNIEKTYQLCEMDQQYMVHSASFTEDDKHIVVSNWKQIKLWDISNRQAPAKINSFTLSNGWAQALDLNQNENFLDTNPEQPLYEEEQVVKLWNVRNEQEPTKSQGVFCTASVGVRDLALNTNGSYLATVSPNASHLWQIKPDRSISCVGGFKSYTNQNKIIALGNEGHYVASTIDNKQVALIDLNAIKWIENNANLGHYLLLQEIVNYKKTNQYPYFPLTNELLQDMYTKIPQSLRDALAYSKYVK